MGGYPESSFHCLLAAAGMGDFCSHESIIHTLRRTVSEMRVETRLAVATGRLTAIASRRFALGGGTSAPGLVALRLAPPLISDLASGLSRGSILVAGTNGKTTTARLVGAMLSEAGHRIVQNRAGANLDSGVASAMIAATDLAKGLSAEWGLFEVDEAALPAMADALRPKIIVLLNLFRDQLDRYGEVDHIERLWRDCLERQPADVTVIYNGDDPALVNLVAGLRSRATSFTVDAAGSAAPEHAADSLSCPRCDRILRYESITYSHLGRFQCQSCGFVNPRDSSVVVAPAGVDQDAVLFAGPAERRIRYPLAGVYNLYNLAAASAIATAASIPLDCIVRAAERVDRAFGRMESVSYRGRELRIALIKNPVGCNQVLDAVAQVGPGSIAVIAINDNLADGTDVSWLWDADFEKVAGWPCRFVVAGIRAGDMAVRLRYAGVDTKRILVGTTDVADEVMRALTTAEPGHTVTALPTYTALLSLHTHLARKGLVDQFWAE